MIVVVNKKTGGKGVYVGRPSVLGNPFPMRAESDRDRVVDAYRDWLRGLWGNPRVRAELERLADLAQAGDVSLVCYCAPARCHADVIKSAIEGILAKRQKGV
jgi:hypothetical protein